MTTAELAYSIDYFIKAGILGGLIAGITCVGLRIVWRPIT